MAGPCCVHGCRSFRRRIDAAPIHDMYPAITMYSAPKDYAGTVQRGWRLGGRAAGEHVATDGVLARCFRRMLPAWSDGGCATVASATWVVITGVQA